MTFRVIDIPKGMYHAKHKEDFVGKECTGIDVRNTKGNFYAGILEFPEGNREKFNRIELRVI